MRAALPGALHCQLVRVQRALQLGLDVTGQATPAEEMRARILLMLYLKLSLLNHFKLVDYDVVFETDLALEPRFSLRCGDLRPGAVNAAVINKQGFSEQFINPTIWRHYHRACLLAIPTGELYFSFGYTL